MKSACTSSLNAWLTWLIDIFLVAFGVPYLAQTSHWSYICCMAFSTPLPSHPASLQILTICSAGAWVVLWIRCAKIVGLIEASGGIFPNSPTVVEIAWVISSRSLIDSLDSLD